MRVGGKEKYFLLQGSKWLNVYFKLFFSIILILINLSWVGTYPDPTNPTNPSAVKLK